MKKLFLFVATLAMAVCAMQRVDAQNEKTDRTAKSLAGSKIAAEIAVPKCDCRKTFEWMRSTFEANDAGFQYILDRKGQQAYNIHNALTIKKIRAAKTHKECEKELSEWLLFFRKWHLWVAYMDPVLVAEWEKRQAEMTKLEEETGQAQIPAKWLPELKNLNETTIYVRIPSFIGECKPAIDTLIAQNRDKILATENLIIDVRGNVGGSDDSFYELLPFLYTNPLRLLLVEFRSTPLNIERLTDIRPDNFVDSLRRHPGEFVNPWGEEVYVGRQDTVYKYPARVGIIIDEDCGSTTEQFLLTARQSTKVKLFGVQTAGAYDISNITSVDSPDGLYRLSYGTSRGLSIPDRVIDDIGIQPDYYLDRGIPRENWVEYTSNVLNGK